MRALTALGTLGLALAFALGPLAAAPDAARPRLLDGGRTHFDYDGDGRADLGVFRPSTATFYIKRSGDGSSFAIQWGIPTDTPVEGDFDGDGRTDVAVWRRSTGTFYVVRSSTGTMMAQQFGQLGDDPRVCADYDGDGISDFAVWRPGPQAVFFVLQSMTGTSIAFPWGRSPDDRPLVGDYDGDGRADFAVTRRGPGGGSGGFWAFLSGGGVVGAGPGSGPGDYETRDFVGAYDWNANGTTEPARGRILVLDPDELPVPADYDGDGKPELATYATGIWRILQPGGTFLVAEWGMAGDYPLQRIFMQGQTPTALLD